MESGKCFGVVLDGKGGYVYRNGQGYRQNISPLSILIYDDDKNRRRVKRDRKEIHSRAVV
jgi:hypothetical protein